MHSVLVIPWCLACKPSDEQLQLPLRSHSCALYSIPSAAATAAKEKRCLSAARTRWTTGDIQPAGTPVWKNEKEAFLTSFLTHSRSSSLLLRLSLAARYPRSFAQELYNPIRHKARNLISFNRLSGFTSSDAGFPSARQGQGQHTNLRLRQSGMS